MADGGDRDSSQESQEHGQESQEYMRELQLKLMEKEWARGEIGAAGAPHRTHGQLNHQYTGALPLRIAGTEPRSTRYMEAKLPCCSACFSLQELV